MPELATRDQAAIRDIPRTCSCHWACRRPGKPDRYGITRRAAQWERTRPDPACVWHKRETTA